MCAYNVLFENLYFWVFYECIKSLRSISFFYRILNRRRIIFTAYSVDVEYFLPNTQQTWNIFYRILSSRGIFFTAYSVDAEYFLPHTQQAWNNFENLPSCFTLSTQQTWNNFYSILSTRRRFFTAYTVHAGDFLPHTQYTQEIFYRILITQSSVKKQNGKYLPNTLHKWFFWFIPQVIYPDGIAQYK